MIYASLDRITNQNETLYIDKYIQGGAEIRTIFYSTGIPRQIWYIVMKNELESLSTTPEVSIKPTILILRSL